MPIAGIVRQGIHAAVTPMHSQLSSLQGTLGARLDRADNAIDKHDLQIQKLEQNVEDNMEQESLNNTNSQLERQVQDLQAQIDELKKPETAPEADSRKTMVVGGFGGISLLPEVTRWLNAQLVQLQCPKHIGADMKTPSFQRLLLPVCKSKGTD